MPLYPDSPAGDQPLVQARRTSTFTLGAAFADIELDATDIENDTNVIKHDDGATDRINILLDGNYAISYQATAPAGAGVTTSLQVRKNDSDVLPGSGRAAKSTDADEPSITGCFSATLNAGDFISLQAMASAGTPVLATGLTFAAIHLAGQKGEKGDASATDVDAIHVDTGGEISGIDEKASPVSDDLLVIEDSEAANIKKRLKVGNLPGGATLSDTAPADVTKDTAAAGVAAEASRQDHKHDVSTAAPGATGVRVGNTSAEGSATSLSRSDHTHAVTAAAPSSVGAANAAGSATTFVRSDHVHAGLTRDAGDFDTFGAKTPASADLALIEDSAAAGAKKKTTLGALFTALGTQLSDTAPADVTKDTAAQGVATEAARQDHKHDVSTAVPGATGVQAGNTAGEGVATSLSRSDHRHSVSVDTPSSVGTANAAGVAVTFVRSDHVHAGLTREAADFNTFTTKATPADADLLLIEDSAAANAKKKATVGSVVATALGVSSATATGTITTTSTTDTAVTGITITPAAGTYVVRFSGSVSNGNNNRSVYASIYAAGVQNAASEREYRRGNQTITCPFACDAVVTVDGAQAITGYWRVTGGTGSMYQRTMIILKVG